MIWDISTIIAALAIIWAIIEFRNNVKINRLERTLNVFPTIREEYFDLTKKVLLNGVVTPNGEILLREYLAKMERFSVGVHCKIYDVSIVERMSGRVLMGQYDNFIREYIANRIKNGMSVTTYCEYEKLIKMIADIRAKKGEATLLNV